MQTIVFLASASQREAQVHDLVYVEVHLLVLVIGQVHTLDSNFLTPRFLLRGVGRIDFFVIAADDVLDRVREGNGIADRKGRMDVVE